MNKLPIKEGSWYVYMLRCKQGRLYTGCRQDLDFNSTYHHQGDRNCGDQNTSVVLVGFKAFQNKKEALGYEGYLRSRLEIIQPYKNP